ncbi:hypothetical protein AEQ63_12020 [Pseudomonas sp. RIT-PI-o]|nr:hypothetical protein AEQ63_12020 [Pseudomonas sp. RIT-PI-o]
MCLFVLVIAGFSDTSESLGRIQTQRLSMLSIIGINKANFFFALRLFTMAPLLKAQDEPPMNLNFAFACMIVVSFAIALGHA